MNTHEDISRRDEVTGTSDRSFGLVFASLFMIIALLPLLHRHRVRTWALLLAGALFLMALLYPSALHAANRLWMRSGLLLSKIVNPVVMGLLFYAIVTPVGFLRSLFGSDPLRLRFDPQASSYWLDRRPPGPPPNTMANQF
ncbi:MAG: hypothetical protein HY237_01995 [Acidobacteria bacterium]|nr:hypothetical protein [Acidobacteriota bacterium]